MDLHRLPGGRARGSPPPVPTLAIRRPRLERLVDEHPDRQVIWVRGPVGAGKTVLVAQWLRQQGSPFAWLSMDAGHNDPDRLLWCVVEAVERLSADAIGAVVAGSRARERIDHAVLWDLLDLVGQELGMRITLVFDDIDRQRDEASQHVIRLLVEQPPEAVRVVLISRSKPQLGLERARLRGDLVEVPPTALRFDRAEIEALVATWAGRHPDATELEQATLGWAAGLRLAQLEAEADATSTLRGFGGLAAEYVREELLTAISEDLGSFLEVTCWVPVLSEALRVEAASQSHRQRPLRSYDLEELPILPVPSRPGAFRYPPILAHAVQQELRQRDPRAAASARSRAAQACRRCGEWPTAIELFLDGGSADDAADVCADLAATGEPLLKIVDELLHELADTAPSSPRWLPWRIRAAVAAGHVEEGRQLLEQADRAVMATDAADEGEPDLTVARAVVAERRGDAEVLLACADSLVTVAEGTRLDPALQRKAHGWRIRAQAWMGDLEGARTALRALEHSVVDPTPAGAVEIALARGWVAWLGGDMTEVANSVAACPAADRDDVEREPELALLAASLHRERGQLAKALPLVQRARAVAVASSHRVIEVLAANELARCHLATSALMDALELVVSTRSTHPDLPAAVDARLRDTEARVRLGRGDVDGAHAILREAPPVVDIELAAARVALRRTPDTARELLDAVDARTPRQAVEKLLLHAQLPGIPEADASAALIAAISAGGHLGLVRTFLDEGPQVSRDLQRLALESSDGTLGRLAALVSQELALAPTRGSTALVDPLTPRELAVLRMLPLPMTNREIAAQMYISLNTLKTHMRAIYRKLDASHRSAAVRRAKALQLV